MDVLRKMPSDSAAGQDQMASEYLAAPTPTTTDQAGRGDGPRPTDAEATATSSSLDKGSRRDGDAGGWSRIEQKD